MNVRDLIIILLVCLFTGITNAAPGNDDPGIDQSLLDVLDHHGPFKWEDEQIMSPGGAGGGCSPCHAPSAAPETSPHENEPVADMPDWETGQIVGPGGGGGGCSPCHALSIGPDDEGLQEDKSIANLPNWETGQVVSPVMLFDYGNKVAPITLSNPDFHESDTDEDHQSTDDDNHQSTDDEDHQGRQS